MLYIHEDPVPAISPGSGPLMQLSHLELSTDPEIGKRDRVKSGNFGHQVNSDTHLQTVEIQMRRLLAPYEPSHQDFPCLQN